MVELEEQIKVVAITRQHARELRELKQKSFEEWEEQNRRLLEDLAIMAGQVDATENRLRELTLQAYAETGDKAPAEGVGIRVIDKVLYQPADALDWAINHSLALKLDTKAFERIAKASSLDFVAISPVPQATIATELKVE